MIKIEDIFFDFSLCTANIEVVELVCFFVKKINKLEKKLVQKC